MAKRGDARSLLAAALIYPNPFPFDTNIYETPVPAEARAWFDMTRHMGAADPLVAWIDATDCTFLSAACNRDAATHHLVELEPDNAVAYALAASIALEHKDTATGRSELAKAARLARYDMHYRDTLGLLHSALNGWSAPAIPEAVRRQHEASGKPDQDWSANDEGDVHAFAIVVGLSFVQIPPRLCWVNHEPASEPMLRHECTAISRREAEASDALLGQLMALAYLVRLDTSEGASIWREQFRQLHWLEGQEMQLMNAQEKMSRPDKLIDVDTMLREGEIQALRILLRAHGIPTEPPVGWLPDDEHDRSLILTGRLPAKK